MSKKWKKHLDDEAADLFDEEKRFKQKQRKFRANCVHSRKGKPRLDPDGGEDKFKCQRCHKRIDFGPFVTEDERENQTQLRASVHFVSTALDIIKIRAAADEGDERSKKIIDYCADLQLKLENVPDVMASFNEKSEKQRKKEKHRDIKVGLDALAFSKKKKNKGGW